MDQRSDQELVELAADGNVPAFRALYHRHVDRVFALVSRMLGPGCPDVDDVVQDVFLQLHRSLGRFRGDARFTTWLYRVTANVATSHVRRLARRREDATPEIELDTPAPGHPERRLMARAALRQLYAHLDDLSPKNRTAFVLYELEGLSLEEMSEVLEVPLHTAAARLRRARMRISEALQAPGALAKAPEKARAGGAS